MASCYKSWPRKLTSFKSIGEEHLRELFKIVIFTPGIKKTSTWLEKKEQL